MSGFNPEPGFSNSGDNTDEVEVAEAKVVDDGKVEDKAVAKRATSSKRKK